MSVGFANEPADDPIDAVVTWVDGGDPVHAAKRAAELAKPQKFRVTAIPGGKSETRFSNNGEIEYCIRGIREHCPWIRTIFLVTDEQTPPFLSGDVAAELGVRVIDHKDIFRGYEFALPTFNSQSIETMLHRIDGLAERFVYFNDDVIVLSRTNADEFFTEDGRIVLRGEWNDLPTFGRMRVIVSSLINHLFDKFLGKVRSMALLAQYRAAQVAGFQRQFLQSMHTPHAMRKSMLASFFITNPEILLNNICYRFRDMKQFAPIPLANHLEIQSGNYIVTDASDASLICFNRQSESAIGRSISALDQDRFLCLQGLEKASGGQRAEIEHFLKKKIKISYG